MNYIKRLIEETIINNIGLVDILTTMTSEFLHEGKSKRDIIEVVIWFSHNDNKRENFEKLLEIVDSQIPTYDYEPLVDLIQIKVKVGEMNNPLGDAHYMQVLKQTHWVVEHLNKNNIFAYGVNYDHLQMIRRILKLYV